MRALVFLVCFTIALPATAEDFSVRAFHDESIRAFHDDFFAAWNRGDVKGLADSLTDDTIYHPYGGTTQVARDEVAGGYRAFLEAFNVRMIVSPEVLQSRGKYGIAQGTYRVVMTPKEGGETSQRSGRYYMDLVKGDDGNWRIARELTQQTADPIEGVQTNSASVGGDGQIRRRFADLDEGQVHYWQGAPPISQGGPGASDKIPLLFLHPGPHSARVQVPLLEALAQHRQVYAPDIMGMGDSSPLPDDATDLAYFADSVLRFADELELDQFALYGSNLSARISVEMALQQPDRIHTLLLNRMVFFEGETLEMWAAGHVPKVTPDQEGAYVTFLWSRLRDLNTYVPWFKKGTENLRGRGLPNADILHLSFVEQMKMAPTMHRAFDAYWAYPLAEKLPQLNVRTFAVGDDARRIPKAETWSPASLGGNVISATTEALAARAAQFDALIGD